MTDMPGEHYITARLLIEDVTEVQAREFADALVGVDVEVLLGDGLIYAATPQHVDYDGPTS